MENNQDRQDQQLEEAILPLFLVYGGIKIVSKITKTTSALTMLMIGSLILVFGKLIGMLYKYIKQSIFESKIKNLLLSHLELLATFNDELLKLGIKKAGFVSLEKINNEYINCIKKEDKQQALDCTITVFKHSHFYLMDLFLQVIYFSDFDLMDIRRLNELKSYKIKTENNQNIDIFNNLIANYYDLIDDFFTTMLELKKVDNSLVIDVYNLEQEFNKKFIELNNYYFSLANVRNN